MSINLETGHRVRFYRKPAHADATGDAIPFYHGGKFHLFSLTPPPGTGVYPDRLRTSWHHAFSENLVDWNEVGSALLPGGPGEPDADGCWTGSVVSGEGKVHAFYTGYSIHATFPQTICHATSDDDGVSWTKDEGNPCLVPKTDAYESLDWRDPYVFYNDEDSCYWLLLSARTNRGPVMRRGCIVLYRSQDLIGWEHYGPLYEPKHTNCPECPELYRMGDTWYLSYSRFSEFGGTIYRVSDSPFGVWRTPDQDRIGNRRFYAAKSMADGTGRRYYFGWIPDRANKSDRGEWYWGGIFAVPHEVAPSSKDQGLEVKVPAQVVKALQVPIDWKYKPVEGNSALIHKTIQVESVGTLTYGFFDLSARSFLMSCKVNPIDCRDHLGFVIKSDRDLASCLLLTLERGAQRVSLLKYPMPVDPFWEASVASMVPAALPGPDGPRVAESPFRFADGAPIDVKILIDHDLIEAFVGERVALTYRSYDAAEYDIGIVVQDGNAAYDEVTFTT